MIIADLSYVETVEKTSTSNINGGFTVNVVTAVQVAGATSLSVNLGGNANAASTARNRLEYRR
ncbi:MAG: hypothetical protein ACRC2R_13005 [Xenococcaceae cyanobacterium]